VGHLPKFATTTTLSDSNLSDDGTTLNYTGSGGVTASSFSVPTGNMQWSSVTGAVPSPVAGRNQLVSGPDGWYVSDNGGAFTGPIGAGGGGGGGPGPSTGLIFGSNPTIPLGTNNPGTGQFLTFNGTQIVGAALPVPTSLNFGSGAGPGTTIPLGAAPTSGQFLAFDGTNLVGVPAPGGSNPGVTSFNERDGAVFPAEGDYDVTQVTGAAPLNSPGFVGRPTAPEPDPNDDSNQIATTSWVLAHGGGGQPQPPPQPLPVAPSPVQGLACNSSSAAVTRLNILNLTLQAGDAVFVFIIASGQNNTISNVSDNSGVLGATVPNTYSARVSANITQSGYHSRWIWSSGIPTAPQITHNASVVHVDFGGSYSNSLACVVVYTGVATLGASQTFPPTGGVVSHTLSRTAVNAGDVMLGQFVASNSSWAAGGAWTPAGVGLGALQTIGGSVAMRLCRNTATTAAENLSCTWTNTGGGNIPVTGGALLLEGGVVAPPPVVFTGPKVIKYVHAQFTAGTSQSTPQTICSSTACPIGIYRLSHYLNVQTACSSGGSIQLHLQFHDLTSAKTWSVPGTALPITSTTAEFHGDQPFTFKSDGTNAITYTYTAAACSGGTGTGTIQLVLEELVGPEEVQ
jgi:hypothetical protein